MIRILGLVVLVAASLAAPYFFYPIFLMKALCFALFACAFNLLLGYVGLQSIPDAYYQAAKIDQASRWAVFRYIELPKMSGVLMIAILLRFMDSFMIYTEPFVVTGGGPGNDTTFLSIDLVKMALGQFDLGPAAAFSLMYFLVILLVSWVFYTVMTSMDAREGRK